MSARGGILTQDTWLPGHGTAARRPSRGWTKVKGRLRLCRSCLLKGRNTAAQIPRTAQVLCPGFRGVGRFWYRSERAVLPRKLKCLGRWRSTRRINKALWKLQASRQTAKLKLRKTIPE